MSILSRKRPGASEALAPAARSLIEKMKYEIVPLKNLPEQIEFLPAGCAVSVTCSPVKGIPATQEITEDLLSRGHRAIPHIAARLVVDRSQTREIAAWLLDNKITEIFLVGGDAQEPAGDYADAESFLADLLAEDTGLSHVGITGYPDGHAMIDTSVLDSAMLAKQKLLLDAGLSGHVSTQMCFDTDQIVRWIEQQRAAGLVLPIHLGIPGVVDRLKLMNMGARLGIGASMRFVKKNGAAIGKLLTSSGYNPAELIDPLVADAARLGIEDLHIFTFNNVDATARWQSGVLESS